MGSVFIYFALYHLNIVTLAQNKSNLQCISLKSILEIKHTPLLTHQIYIFLLSTPQILPKFHP